MPNPRVGADPPQVADVEGAHVVAVHRIAVELVVAPIDLIGAGQPHAREHRPADRPRPGTECRRELGLEIQERRRTVAGHQSRRARPDGARPIARRRRRGSRHRCRSRRRGASCRPTCAETPAASGTRSNTLRSAHVVVHPAVAVGEEPVAVEGAEEHLDALRQLGVEHGAPVALSREEVAGEDAAFRRLTVARSTAGCRTRTA